MAFNYEVKILIKHSHQSKAYNASRLVADFFLLKFGEVQHQHLDC